jgi:deoxyuridine 5'-triphosphate nucleotidohydrolase
MAQFEATDAMESPRRATTGSAGLDLCSTPQLVLTPHMGVQLVDTDFIGPLPADTVGLILGRSSVTVQGLTVHPGVIDSDFTGKVKIMVSSPRGIVAISPVDRIAQLLLFTSCHSQFPAKDSERGDKGFGSTGTSNIFCSLNLDTQTLLKLRIEGNAISGLLDTGADHSIISTRDWPSCWLKQQSEQTLRGLGYAQMPEMSFRFLYWKDEEGHSGQFQPYVLAVPVSLWGRDLMTQMGFVLTNKGGCGSKAHDMMLGIEYIPGKGLGQFLQGRTSPVQMINKQMILMGPVPSKDSVSHRWIMHPE